MKNKSINKLFYLLLFTICSLNTFAQKNYFSETKNFRKNYIQTHDVVKGDSIKYLRFFPINKKYAAKANYEPLAEVVAFKIPTSSGKSKEALKIGYLHFKIKGKDFRLSVYQLKALLTSEKYHDFVFVPFTDLTSGLKSYGGGRYLDFKLPELSHPDFTIDFNKAYNPSCIYASGFNCPIPPRENDLAIRILAGEKIYSLYYTIHQE